MTEEEITALVASFDGTAVLVAAEENDAPEISWGDVFFYYDPLGQRDFRRLPFATIVHRDYPGFDEESDLGRDGVFRVNISLGRARFTELVGNPEDVDYAALDRLIPHPVYGTQFWVSILNPDATAGLVRSLLTEAHARASRSHSGGED